MSIVAVDKATNLAGTAFYNLMLLETGRSVAGNNESVTGIPSWVKRVTVTLIDVSSSGSSIFLIRLGPSGSYATTGYVGATASSGGNTTVTTGFGLNQGVSGSDTTSGNLIIVNPTGNTWIASGTFSRGGSVITSSAGSVTLSSVLSQIRLTTVNGTDTFDSGSVNVLYEGYNV